MTPAWGAVLAASAAAISYVIARGMRSWSHRRDVLDLPNVRSSHSVPTPRGGGWGIVVPVLLAAVALTMTESGESRRVLLAFAAGGAVVAGVSWWDDLRTLSSAARLVSHAIAAALLLAVASDPLLADSYWGDHPAHAATALGLTFVWLVGLTNAYNFMDGIDGIAGLQGVVAGLGWAAAGVWAGQQAVAVLGLVTAAACLGFLLLNWPPASIFMGDVGSAFLGYTCAALPLVFAAPPGGVSAEPAVGAALLMVWPFIFDASLTFLYRLGGGENVLHAHRSHLYQRLARTREWHWAVTLLYGGLASVGAVAAIVWLRSAATRAAIVVVIAIFAAGLWGITVARERQH